MSLQTSPESPAPVRLVSKAIGDWVHRLGALWVEGQLTDMRRRGSWVYATLRDPSVAMSVPIMCERRAVDAVQPALSEGARVVVHAKPQWYHPSGSLTLQVSEIRQVGLGELLARLERLRVLLSSEGLFDPRRKQPLPFLPGVVGLITGRGSDAEHDVLENARRRWPAVRFEVRNVATQGVNAASQVIDALQELDRDPAVAVIVIARGGGSVEALLPFSDEALVRAVAACRTPVVSAIGHEPDSPLLDHVADVRASTPTDAAKRIVPDVAEQLSVVTELRRRSWHRLTGLLAGEQQRLDAMRSRPVLADPTSGITRLLSDVQGYRDRARRHLGHQLDREALSLESARARVLALSPAATLARGYAVAQAPDGRVVRSAQEVEVGTSLRVRLAAGELIAAVRERSLG